MNKLAIVAAAALATATFGMSAAFAQDATGDFAKADANKDGSVTLEEAMGVYPTLTQDLFTKADANADGKLDAGEFAALVGLTAGVAGGNGTENASSSAATDASSSSAM
jgi:hypothetical protein